MMSTSSALADRGLPSAAPRRPIPPFTEEHEEFRSAVRGWIARELRPHVAEWEDAAWMPNEAFAAVAQQGYFGLGFPEAYGGDDDVIANAVFAEELNRCGSGGVAASIGAHAFIATPPIAKFGTDDQKQRYLRRAIAADAIGALGITEPDAGSDVAGLKTSARRVDGGWVVNGSKVYITNGVRADFMVTAVRTAPGKGHRGISLMVVDTDQPGYEASSLHKHGWHASDTALITLDDVFVPAENLLGDEGEGFKLVMANFQWERLVMALEAVGLMEEAFERTVRYASERTAFGRRIIDNQVIRHRLVDMETTIYRSRSMTYDALRRHAAGEDALRPVTMAKLATQRAAYELVDGCVQIHGGAGYMREYEIERMLRDARIGPIGGGTDQIMREILGRSLAA
jgi:acyl-CoA dehydrogenase